MKKMPFEFERLKIPDIILIRPKVFKDERGFFIETYKYSEFKKNGVNLDFVQDNHSRSKKGILRGLHYQMNPKAQGKLVRVVSGSLLNVAVDIRQGSPYYGKWVAVKITADNKYMLWVPPGFANGVYILEDDTELLYKVTEEYSHENERGIIWNDPDVGIVWPDANPMLSERDMKLPLLKDAENNFKFQKRY